MSDNAERAAEELTRFIGEIDIQVTTKRYDLDRKWSGVDALPLYPTDGNLPTTTVGTVRALLAGYRGEQDENARLREEVARGRLTLQRILVRLAVSVALSMALWGLCTLLLLDVSVHTFEVMFAMTFGAGLGQFLIWQDQRRGRRHG